MKLQLYDNASFSLLLILLGPRSAAASQRPRPLSGPGGCRAAASCSGRARSTRRTRSVIARRIRSIHFTVFACVGIVVQFRHKSPFSASAKAIFSLLPILLDEEEFGGSTNAGQYSD